MPLLLHSRRARGCGILRGLLTAFTVGPDDLAALIHADLDESSDKGERFFSVGGYLFDADSVRVLDAKWAATLQRFSLPYFRMSACVHGNEPFDKLTKDQRSEVEAEIIGHIKEHAKVGFCTSISERLVLDSPIDAADPHGSAYTLLCFQSLLAVRDWVHSTSFRGNIVYFFEAGDRFQRQANSVMDTLFLLPEERAGLRYAGHAFVDKAQVRPVQSADVLTWHVATDRRREQEGKGRRADFQQLLKCRTLERRLTATNA